MTFSKLAILCTGLGLALSACGQPEGELQTDRAVRSSDASLLPGSCVDACGDKSNDGCWCDDLCDNYGDCCADKAEVCDTEPPPIMCGGFGGFQCPDDLVCVDDPNDDCDLNDGADCSGICVEPPMCGGIGNINCPEGLDCVDDPEDDCDLSSGADCSGICLDCPGPGEYCAVMCDGGEWMSGSAGCPIPLCECPPPPPPPQCDEVMCTLYCELGFKVDENGCDVCECIQPSCEGSCGGQSAEGDCHCDSLCASYGDCCSDYEDAC